MQPGRSNDRCDFLSGALDSKKDGFCRAESYRGDGAYFPVGGLRDADARREGGEDEDRLLHRERGADALARTFGKRDERALGQTLGEAVEPALGLKLVGVLEPIGVPMRRVDADERERSLADIAAGDGRRPD